MFAEIWSNCQSQNSMEVYNNVTKYLLNNGGKMIAGKSAKFFVFSIWKFDGLMIYIELFGDDCGYRILN